MVRRFADQIIGPAHTRERKLSSSNWRIKALDPFQFANDIDNYKILPWTISVGLAFYLPWLEMLCGLALIFRLFYRGAFALLTALISIFLVGISLYIRLRMEESPIFEHLKSTGMRSAAPLKDAFAHWENLRRVLISLFGATVLAVAATFALFVVALWLLWRQPALISRALPLAPPLRKHADRVHQLESQIYTFASRHPRVLVPLAMAELGFHALGVAEVYLTLWLLNVPSTSLLTAFLFETANRLITVVFKFIPLRLGVDETGTAWFAQMIGLTARTGLSLGIIRRARVLFWAAAGGILLVREGFVPRAPHVRQDQAERG